MTDHNKTPVPFWRRQYKFSLTNPHTHREEYKFRAVPLHLLLALLTLIVLVVGATIVFTHFTPVSQLFTNRHSAIKQKELDELHTKVQNMEYTIKSQNLYLLKIRSLLSGKPAEELSQKEVELDSVQIVQFSKVNRVKEDSLIRDMISNGGYTAIAMDKGPDAQTKSAVSSDFFSPITGTVVRAFEPAISHWGTDIVAPKHTPIKSIARGTVIFADWSRETGHSIYVQHDNDLISAYKHNSALLKSSGQRVAAGEAIAIIGNSGENTSGPHVHVELWKSGRPINPEQMIKFN